MQGNDRDFLGRDAYPTWQRRVKGARTSVRIYSPYLGGNVVDLIGNAHLPPGRLAVVTDLSPASGALDFRSQLLAIARLLRAGVPVRSLPRLHAKVLLIDGKHVTVGSQNFTSNGRKNREATVVPREDMSESQFVAVLDDWYETSEPISLDWVERLLRDLAEPAAALKSAQAQLVLAYDTLEAERQRERERLREEASRRARLSMQARIRAAASASSFRTAQAVAHARLAWAGDYEYQTLMADHDNDLTSWKIKADGFLYPGPTLDRGAFYPAILGPDGRMRFVRVNKTRITYVWTGVIWGSAITFGNRRIWLSTSFPSSGTDEVNVIVKARPDKAAKSGFQVPLHFDGTQMTIVGDGEPFGPTAWAAESARGVMRAVLDSEAERLRLFQKVLDPAPNAREFKSNKNAADHFTPGRHQISLAEAYDRRVLLIEHR